MKEKYGYFALGIAVWLALAFLFSFIIKIQITAGMELAVFVTAIIFAAINLIVFAIGYVNYKMDEKPYALLYCMNSCPLILALIFMAINTWFYLSFIFVPIIFNTIFVGIIALGSGRRLSAFQMESKEIMKYILFVVVYYAIMGFVIFLHWILGMSTSAPPLTIAILFYAMSFLILIPLA